MVERPSALHVHDVLAGAVATRDRPGKSCIDAAGSRVEIALKRAEGIISRVHQRIDRNAVGIGGLDDLPSAHHFRELLRSQTFGRVDRVPGEKVSWLVRSIHLPAFIDEISKLRRRRGGIETDETDLAGHLLEVRPIGFAVLLRDHFLGAVLVRSLDPIAKLDDDPGSEMKANRLPRRSRANHIC